MSKIVVINHVQLHGAMPVARTPRRNTRDGFAHGAGRRVDDQVVAATYARVEEGGGLQLLWLPQLRGDAQATGTLRTVRSKTGSTGRPSTSPRRHFRPLPWPNSTLLEGDIGIAISDLKHELTRI